MSHSGIADPKVSIIIPVYNGSNYLRAAIDSALAQTYESIEVIVINDGSNDGGATEKISLSYGDKIRYFRKENGGVASALNFGVEKMTGSYFSWLSHDDLYEKTKIEDEVNFITSSQIDNTIVVCNARILFENGIKKKALIDRRTFKYFDIFLATSANIGVNGCTLLVPKKALVESGGFDTNLPTTQDYDLWFRLTSKFNYQFILLEKNLVIYRRHDQQDSVQKQAIHLEEGDKLRYEILKTIDYKRFEEYFLADKANIKHTWGNYNLYKTRGYKRAASMMLKNILRYYYENDRKSFFRAYVSEIKTKFQIGQKLTGVDRQNIAQEYARLLESGADIYPVKEPASRENRLPKARIHRVARRLGDSIKRDGIYLTGEKIVRKIYTKIARG